MSTIHLRTVTALLLTASLALSGLALAQAPHTHEHSFAGAEKWAKVFDDPKRDAWQKPHEVIQALRLKPDAVIADIGAGTGYFAVRFARMLPQGHVYAVDTERDMVRHLGERAKREGLTNITAVSAAPDDPKLPRPADMIVFVNVYHHIGDRKRYFERLAGALANGGRVAVIDFKLDSPVGPPKRARIEPERVKSELRNAGYTLVEEHGFLPHQYFLVFQPAKG